MKKRIFALLLVLVLALSLLPLSAAAGNTLVGNEIITISGDDYSRESGKYPEYVRLDVLGEEYANYCLRVGAFTLGDDFCELKKANHKPGTSVSGDFEKIFGACIFELSGSGDTEAPAVRNALSDAGYALSLNIYPTEVNDKFAVSCAGSCYPAEDSLNPDGWSATKYTFAKQVEGSSCAGTWMIEATLSKGDTTLHAYTFQTVSFHNEVTWDLRSCDTVEAINMAIANRTGLYLPEGLSESDIYIRIILRANGTDNGSENPLAGYIDIPEAFDTFAGLRLECPFEDDAHLYIEGGVKTNIRQLTVQNIYFYGAGADKQTWNDGSGNYGLVGPGQGVFRNCEFHKFYHAVHRYSNNDDIGVASFGGSNTEFNGNGVAIYIDVDQDTGGNDDLENCKFVGNGTAIHLHNIPSGLDLVYVKVRGNRFAGNKTDVDNQNNSILWMPYNTFEAAPVFNNTKVKGCPAVVACPYWLDNNGPDPDVLVYPADSYLRNESPKDALIPVASITDQNFNMADDKGNIVATFSFN